jgi:hypothetical protein
MEKMNRIEIEEKIQLPTENRDGEVYVIKTTDSEYYLVLTSQTFGCEEVFLGMGCTSDMNISADLFQAIKKALATP